MNWVHILTYKQLKINHNHTNSKKGSIEPFIIAKPTTSHQPKFNPLIIEHTAYIMQHEACSMKYAPYLHPSTSTIPTHVPGQSQHQHQNLLSPSHYSHQPYWQFELEAPHFGSTELTLENQNHQSSKNHTSKTYQLLVLPNHYHTLAIASLRATEFSK